MKITILIILTITYAQCYLEIDILREMIDNTFDRWRLDLLNKEKNIAREKIQQTIDAILQKQSEEIQNIYNNLLADDRAKEKDFYKARLSVMRNQDAPQEALELIKQIYDITQNMSLSRNEERKKVKQLERELHTIEMNMLTPLNED